MFVSSVLSDRARGALIGLAIGDALGTTNEFKHALDCKFITDMVGGGPFSLKPGQWTDDTSMALCLADSLVNHGMDLRNQLEQYQAWYEHGHMSCTGSCFDIGSTIYAAIRGFMKSGEVFSNNTHDNTSGNGNIMRMAPAVLKYHRDAVLCVAAAEMQSMTTHASLICKDAAALMAEIMFRCLHRNAHEHDKSHVLQPASLRSSVSLEISEINSGAYKHKTKQQVFNTGGFVASSLEFALWCFHHTSSFEECVLTAANAGGDSDTNAAIAGQIAGAYYGMGSMPEHWIKNVAWSDEIIKYADKLLD